MRGDSRYSRYFAYLSFFSFSMIGLVVVDNLFFLYIFWELVGLSSYLLIAFWFEKPEAAAAGKKAFITTRIGDVGMFVGILLIFFQTNGLLKYDDVFAAVSQGLFNSTILGISVLTIAGICLFLGAVGKSAQFPLHIWLPDAMEGPTPISALIHAATMVAAGVYLVTRMFPFLSNETLLVIAYTGGFTTLFAATMALTHTDIKKILAYSTVSQLGLMMLGLGVGDATAGFFHLVTHAAFKASLFLCAGSVIHATHSQEIDEMGGLRSKMPLTFWASVIATLAISGVPFFSGFVSKDLILGSVYSFAKENPVHILLPIFGFGGALLTAFYMFRWLFLIFFGSSKKDHAHESPWTMTVPLICLSILSLAVIFTGSPIGLGELKLFGPASQWFEYLIVSSKTAAPDEGSHLAPLILSLSVVTLGILLSYLTYFKKIIPAEKIAEKFQGIYKTLTNLYWIDEFYEWLIVNNQIRLNNFLANFDNRVIDETLVDGWAPITAKTSFVSGDFDNRAIDQTLVDGTGRIIGKTGTEVRKIQTGKIQQYLLLGLGAVCITLLILLMV
jgi:NADH-quinone oxidoreductase subunit L